jgi:hypothetical protein
MPLESRQRKHPHHFNTSESNRTGPTVLHDVYVECILLKDGHLLTLGARLLR